MGYSLCSLGASDWLLDRWIGPKLILDNAKKLSDESDLQSLKIFQPMRDAAYQQYRADMAAAGKNQMLQGRAAYRQSYRLSEIRAQDLDLPSVRYYKLKKNLESPNYYAIILGVAFLVFCNAWYWHCHPWYEKAINRKIDDLCHKRWTESEM